MSFIEAMAPLTIFLNEIFGRNSIQIINTGSDKKLDIFQRNFLKK